MGRFLSIGIVLVFAITVPTNGEVVSQQAQDRDTVAYTAKNPLVVSATRSAKRLEDVSVPTTVLNAAMITETGQRRLDGVLTQIPGVTFFQDHGQGIQMQGFSPEYTLILIDGEPVIGRMAGTLDVSRITLHGVKHIEVVEGPSSSLYGSEALAGVVNIITKTPEAGFSGQLSTQWGTHAAQDHTFRLGWSAEELDVQWVVNQYASDGFDHTPNEFGVSAPAFDDLSTSLTTTWRFAPRSRFKVQARASSRDLQSSFSVRQSASSSIPYLDESSRQDFSVAPSLEWAIGSRVIGISRGYWATYQTDQHQFEQQTQQTFYQDQFDQDFLKLEQQLNVLWSNQHLSMAGVGLNRETLGGDRYESTLQVDGTTGQPKAHQWFAFVQHEWIPSERFELNLSGRYDRHEDYDPQLSPRISARWQANDALTLRASVGSGFKAPAFRQLYLDFNNSNVGYSVFGSTKMGEGLQSLLDQGVLSNLFLDPSNLGTIQSETSNAFNLGATYSPTGSLRLRGHLFYNDVSNLIETQPVAQKSNGQFVYGYFNLDRIYTRGARLDVDASRTVGQRHRLSFRGGYQFLQAHDREVVDDLRAGRVFGRDINNRDVELSMADYSGLFGRSTHHVSGTMTYQMMDSQQRQWDAAISSLQSAVAPTSVSITSRWRSKYGYRDLDGNGFANREDEFVDAHLLLDATVTKTFSLENTRGAQPLQLTLQGHVRNLTATTFPDTNPSLAGRQWAVSVSFEW
ncbi:MAG: TonB-dependent receptor [Balneolaceae bacterium]|nr:TonB-dependent receptor [Balneolaceae bacterium]